MSSLHKSLRIQRKLMGLSLQQLAQQIGADAGNLSRIERGLQSVTESMLA